MTLQRPLFLAASNEPTIEHWLEITAWGGILVITGYLMGTLYEHKSAQLQELRDTYEGVLMLLRHFISKDKYTENHSYRVSVYAARIAARLDLDQNRIEDVRAAALLHDIGKLEISRDLLYKAARLTKEEFEHVQQHVDRGVEMLETVGGSLRRVLPIILAHHDKFDGSGYHPLRGDEIPIEARIISVADVYDALTSDRPYRKAMSPYEAKEILVKGRGTDFDPKVIDAFLEALKKGEMEVAAVQV
jgi:putative nucleotidyltransferase with HDIG domain